MSVDSIYLGETPCDEPCQQYGTDHYDARLAKAECCALMNQIERIIGKPAEGAWFKVVKESHSNGNTLSLYVFYRSDIPAAIEYAFAAEEKLEAALVEDAMQKFTDVNQELEAALAEPPPEAQTEAEKIAYCAGWWDALEAKRLKSSPSPAVPSHSPTEESHAPLP